MKPVTILKRARKLIENPRHWIKGQYLAQQDGARAFCADGACMAASLKGAKPTMPPFVALPREYWTAFSALNRAVRGGSIVEYNDAPRRTHSQVLTAFDRAITLVKKDART